MNRRVVWSELRISQKSKQNGPCILRLWNKSHSSFHNSNQKHQSSHVTFSKEGAKRLDSPKARWNTFPVKGNLSLAFISISWISAGSVTDTNSWVGPNHSLTIGPYFWWDSDNTSGNQKAYVISLKNLHPAIILFITQPKANHYMCKTTKLALLHNQFNLQSRIIPLMSIKKERKQY